MLSKLNVLILPVNPVWYCKHPFVGLFGEKIRDSNIYHGFGNIIFSNKKKFVKIIHTHNSHHKGFEKL